MESPFDDSKNIQLLNSIAETLELIGTVQTDHEIISICCFFLQNATSEALIISAIRCSTAYIKKCSMYCREAIRKGLYRVLLDFKNPRQNDPKISLNIAIQTRHFFMHLLSFNEIVYELKHDIDYSFFTDNFFEFPLLEQKKMIKYTKDLSNILVNDECIRSLVQISQFLTHFDKEVIINATLIIQNCIKACNFYQLKIVDPRMAKYISVALETITDSQIISILLSVLFKLTQISYEYAEQLVILPIDFELIVHNIGIDPNSDSIENILNIIHQIFSYSTLRKSGKRNQNLSKFAFYVQSLLIQIIKQNSGDLNKALECLSISFDAYVPLKKINDVLDVIIHSILSGNEKLNVESFYKKLTETQKIKEGMKQYKSLKISKPKNIKSITDFKSFIEISNFHSSVFELNESLPKSILSFLKTIKSAEQIKESYSIEEIDLIKESLIKITDTIQKIFNLNFSKLKLNKNEESFAESAQKKSRITLYNQSGRSLYLILPLAINLTICEVFFNYMPKDVSKLPIESIQNARLYVGMNGLSNMIDYNSINSDIITAYFNHLLCFNSNMRFTSPHSFGYYNFYNMKCQGKIFSAFDNIAALIFQTDSRHVEMIEISKTQHRPTKDDFLNRSDVIHKLAGQSSPINYDAFHKSFINSYPTLNLKKKSMNYLHKTSSGELDSCLQIMHDIHRLFPDLRNDIGSVFVNKTLGLRIIENLNFDDLYRSNISTSILFYYPFLFPFDIRYTLLRALSLPYIDGLFLFMKEIRKKRLEPELKPNRMTVTISRENVYDDGQSLFNLLGPSSLFYDIKFKGESGMGQGPTNEFYRVFSQEMQRNKLDIWLNDSSPNEEGFVSREGENGLFPCPSSVRRPDLFFTLGSLLAKAIVLEIVLPFHISPAFFKLVSGERIEISEVSQHYARAIEDREALSGLPFTIPGREDVELRDGGKFIITDESNVDLYVELMKRVLTFDVTSHLIQDENNAWKEAQRVSSTSSILSTAGNNEEKIPYEIASFIERYSFELCASMFREGFGRIIPWNLMRLFTSDEMSAIVEGEEDLSLTSLRKNVVIGGGFNENSPQIVWLFEIISNEFSRDEKKLFTRFVTGSDTFGVFGLKKLKPKLSISKSEKGDNSLPSVSTCTNSLKLPEYSSKEKLKKKLLYAIHECNETFHMS